MIETIYIVRHGFRLNWQTTTWQSKTGLPRDPPLAAYGVAQAQELGDYFKSLPADKRPTAIFSSPYFHLMQGMVTGLSVLSPDQTLTITVDRCIETSIPTSSALGIPLYVEPGLSEWYSPVAPGTGLHPRPQPAAALAAFFPPGTLSTDWPPVWLPPRSGEDIAAVHARAAGFLQAFAPRAKHTRVLLVTHAATAIVLTRALLGKPGLPLRVGCCSLTELVRGPGTGTEVLGAWEALRLADGAHLRDGAPREWGLEDIEIADGKVVEDPGVPGTENEIDEPVGCQVQLSSL